MFKKICKSNFNKIIKKLKKLQSDFLKEFKVNDMISNSKMYEIFIANDLGHILIPGHSGSKDAKDNQGNIFEYKHYKETSSNHSWTFNDYSITTINSLKEVKSIIFAHIDDRSVLSIFDWYYEVPGNLICEYLHKETKKIRNNRKMINISPNQIEKKLNISRKQNVANPNGKYTHYLNKIVSIITNLESFSGTKNILTSNKFWELLIAVNLNHNINSEQGGRKGAHDAFDKEGRFYEYKISKTHAWNFQDISENVLNKYLNDHKIILAVVDKKDFCIKNIYSANPKTLVSFLRKKLKEKIKKSKKPLRRLQVSIGKKDLEIIGADKIY